VWRKTNRTDDINRKKNFWLFFDIAIADSNTLLTSVADPDDFLTDPNTDLDPVPDVRDWIRLKRSDSYRIRIGNAAFWTASNTARTPHMKSSLAMALMTPSSGMSPGSSRWPCLFFSDFLTRSRL
jgi:hypothetical protein